MQRRGNKIALGVLIILAIITAGVMIKNSFKSTIREDLKDFAVEDTASINKIFMAGKNGKKVLLERQPNGQWKVNGKYIARADGINTLLYTIKKVQVKAPLAKAAFNNIIKRMATKSVKIEIYQNNDLVKTYYVGGPNQESNGTYMMIENSATPFITHIEGFEGYLTPRYFVEEYLWRDRSIFNLKPFDIQKITLNNFEDPKQSFEIKALPENKFEVNSPFFKKPLENYDTLALRQYLLAFQNINYEAIVYDYSKEKIDSVIRSQPVFELSVTDKKNVKTSIKAFYIKAQAGTENEDGTVRKWDIDRLYALIDNENLVFIQYFSFDPLLKKISYFENDRQVVKK